MQNLRSFLCRFVLLMSFLVLAGSAAAQTVLNVSAESLGAWTLDVPHSSTKVQKYLVVLVSVTDEHGMPVGGLKAADFAMWGVSIGLAVPTNAIELKKFKVEEIVATSDAGSYVLQISSTDPNVLSFATGHPAHAVIRVVRTAFTTVGGGAPTVVASGQTVF